MSAFHDETCILLGRKPPLAMRVLRLPVTSGEHVLAMRASGGILRVVLGGHLVRDGCLVYPSILAPRQKEEGFQVVRALMEPGKWTLCRRAFFDPSDPEPPAPKCVDGELLPGGTLSLDVDEN